MYKSPISILERAVETIIERRENAIFAKVQDAFDVQVDKEELIRALQYDRDQYEKGYRDAKQEQKWIPVSERLPEQYRSVIVWTRDRELGEAEYDGKLFRWAYDDDYANVTHWMPMPEPPKEEYCEQ